MLGVTANILSQGNYETISKNPMIDETGLLMQMVSLISYIIKIIGGLQ